VYLCVGNTNVASFYDFGTVPTMWYLFVFRVFLLTLFSNKEKQD